MPPHKKEIFMSGLPLSRDLKVLHGMEDSLNSNLILVKNIPLSHLMLSFSQRCSIQISTTMVESALTVFLLLNSSSEPMESHLRCMGSTDLHPISSCRSQSKLSSKQLSSSNLQYKQE